MRINTNYLIIAGLPLFLLMGANSIARGGQESIKVVGGERESLASWPNAMRVTNQCGGTLIGPNVVITAGHCIGDKGPMDPCSGMDVEVNVLGSSACCQPACRGKTCSEGVDFALCQIDSKSVGDFSIRSPFETLSSDQGWSMKGVPVILAGFGLPVTTELHVGKANVLLETSAPPDGFLKVGGTINGVAAAAACSGDSGGGVFLEDGSEGRTFVGVIVIGANSMGNCIAGGETGVVDITFANNSSFISAWQKSHVGAQICGIDKSLTSMCRKDAGVDRANRE